ncbi:hypothetical protein IWW36_002279 [Coemansia brasiliensis]|uniref:Uncharacterized protein n=1 Tax=Coemansia brasiliensis TaxID=2650707 RepID=A0A9W8IG64_9FUNG|nr:hypothetical protein IWW36_002279 [Coemansia brasiliensis]
MVADINEDTYELLNLKCTQDTLTEKLHLLPCSVSHDGTARTDYFILSTEPDQTLVTSFRGRQLQGCQISLPADYTGHVVVESMAADDTAFEDSNSKMRLELQSTEQFDKFTVWEHDRLPQPADDEMISALKWIEVAACIHED